MGSTTGSAARIDDQGPVRGPSFTAVPGTGGSLPPAEQPPAELAEPRVVEVRRNALLAGAVGVLAAAVSIAYLGRATTTGAPLDWVLTGVTAILAVAWLWSLVDARTPLLVADVHGVRVRLGRTWEGLAWRDLSRVEHHPRRGVLGRDGRIVLVPQATTPLIDSLDRSGRQQAAWSRRLHGSPFAVPLGISTRLAGVRAEELEEVLRGLADGDAAVVVVAPESESQPESGSESEAGVDGGAPGRRPDPRPAFAALIGALASRIGRADQSDQADRADRADRAAAGPAPGSAHLEAPEHPGSPEDPGHPAYLEDPEDLADFEAVDEAAPDPDDHQVSETPSPARERRVAARSEVRHLAGRGASGDRAPVLPEAAQLRRPDGPDQVTLVEDTEVWGARVRPITRVGDVVEPIVLDDFSVEPASDPVIGPELTAARTRLGLSVDQLADRTRIRPHVLESIEVDDFAPCGGDFYARGHLRTLARVLGIDPAALVATYDERYADAPIDPRRVFAAELATGAHGSIRSTRGGPSWTMLVAAVMVVVLAWSVARLIMDDPVELQPAPALNGSAGPAGPVDLAPPVPLVVRAVEGGASVTVRDAEGEVRYRGDLAMGESTELEISPPIRIEASDGGAIETVVDGRDTGRLGEVGQPASDTLVPR